MQSVNPKASWNVWCKCFSIFYGFVFTESKSDEIPMPSDLTDLVFLYRST